MKLNEVPDLSGLLDSKQIAQKLNIKVDQVYNYLSNRCCPAVRVGCHYFGVDETLEYIQNRIAQKTKKKLEKNETIY